MPFNQTHLVYPFLDNIVNSMVDPESLDTTRFPKFLKASVYSTTVNSGEILYIPRGWWHYLRSENPSISINHWFGPPIASKRYLYQILRLGYKPTVRMFSDLFRYSVLGRKYKKDFFFTPNSNGERLYNLIRYGDFSYENNPVKQKHNTKKR